MPPTPKVFLEIDDNSSSGAPAFSNEPSMWSFVEDMNLATRTAAEVFFKLHEIVGASQFRGFPLRVSVGTLERLKGFDASEVTWFTAAELAGDRIWLPGDHPDDQVYRTLRALFETVDIVASHFGSDRVRLVFAF